MRFVPVALCLMALAATPPLAGQRAAPSPAGTSDSPTTLPAARGVAGQQSSQRDSDVAILQGQVTRQDSAQVVRVARIRLEGVDTDVRMTGVTDDDGRFELRDVPPGRYTLTASKAGLVTRGFGQKRPFESPPAIEVSPGRLMDRLDISLVQGGALIGHVRDEFGGALAGAAVVAFRQHYRNGTLELAPTSDPDRTDDRGQFRLYGLPPGVYVVGVSVSTVPPEGALLIAIPASPLVFNPGVPSATMALPVTVNVGEEVAGVDVTLPKTATAALKGQVLTSVGGPAPGATVSVTGGLNSEAVNRVPVQPDGSFVVPKLASGAYTVTAQANGESAAARVTLDGEDVDVLLAMVRGATVRGRITFDDQAAKGALSPNAVTVVLARVNSVPLIRRLRIRDDWTFETTDLAGTFKFVVTLPAGWGLQRVVSRGTDVIDAGLEMAGSDVDGVDIRLTRRLTSVGGVVRDRRGSIVDDASVVVFATDARRWNPGTRFIRATRTDAQGRYSLHGLPAGSYHAVALDYVEPGEETNPGLLERLRKAAGSFTLADSEAAFLDLRLSEP